MKDYVNSAALQEYTTKLVAKLKTLFPSTPTAAATVANMTDHSKTYVYVGSETGYTAGDWYYWDGSTWTSGGPFQATSIITDTTLAVAGEAADAKATGDAIAAAKTAVLNAMAPAYSNSATYAVGDYVNYNGSIYRCTTAITTAESWTSGHWTAVVLGADLASQVSDLKTQLNNYFDNHKSTNLWNYDTTIVGEIATATGIVNTSSTSYVTSDFIPISYGDTVFVCYKVKSSNTLTTFNASTGNGGKIVFFDANKTYIAGKYATDWSNPLTVSYQNAAYIRIGLSKSHFTNTDRIYGCFKSVVTIDTFEEFYDYTVLNDDIIVPQVPTDISAFENDAEYVSLDETLRQIAYTTGGEIVTKDFLQSITETLPKKYLSETGGITSIDNTSYSVNAYAVTPGIYRLYGDSAKITGDYAFASFMTDLSNTNKSVIVMGNQTPSTYDLNYTVTQNGYICIAKVTGYATLFLGRYDTVVDSNNVRGDKYITCWGDSLTAQGGWTTKLAELTEWTVNNCGIGGEVINAIRARQGADCYMADGITIPATATAVTVSTYSDGIDTALGKNAKPLLQGGNSAFNPCTIAGISGTLAWTGQSYNDSTGTWTFTRASSGDATVISRPTPIITKSDKEWNSPWIMIILMGQNNFGYNNNNTISGSISTNSTEDCIDSIDLMIDHANAYKTLVLGIATGTSDSNATYEGLMQAKYGRYFISLRQYLAHPVYSGDTLTTCWGLQDAGLTPTSADLTDIALGKVPPQLLADGIHFTDACKAVIGNMLYKKIQELNLI